MGQHAKRFDSVAAPKGSRLRVVVDALKATAEAIEEHYDPNSPAVVGAMQRFEQGLGLLSMLPDLDPPEVPEQKGSTRRGSSKRATEEGADDASE